MARLDKSQLSTFLRLLQRHRGEAKGSYDQVAEAYDSFNEVWDGLVAAKAIEEFNGLIKKHVKPGSKVLDAGAGTGERTRALLAHSDPAEVVAFDASAEMLAIAVEKVSDSRVKYQVGDVVALPFPDNTFDVVVSTWVVEIMDEPKRVVEEYVRVIKPTGIVLYAFCSLPDGPAGDVLKFVADRVAPTENPVTHLLSREERPFHECEQSSLVRFSGGLTTVATVSKCCPIVDDLLPCRERLQAS